MERGATVGKVQPVAAADPMPVMAAHVANVSGSAQQPAGSVVGIAVKLGLDCTSTWFVNAAPLAPE